MAERQIAVVAFTHTHLEAEKARLLPGKLTQAGLADDRGVGGRGLQRLEHQMMRFLGDVDPALEVSVIQHLSQGQKSRGGTRENLKDKLALLENFFRHLWLRIPFWPKNQAALAGVLGAAS